LPTLKVILKVAKEQLIQKDAVREKAQKKMRKATSLSKQAILLMHQKKYGKAKRLIEDAKEIIDELKNMANEFPDIIYSGMFSAALQEYAEAKIFQKLIEEDSFLSFSEINVSAADYTLGLADVIGEFRRFTLDALRQGNAKKGEDCLEKMEEIYIELMAMDEAFMLVQGLRRKCDIARRIIETTRGEVTQEVRRKELEDHLKCFKKAKM
jgi:translin